MYPALKQALKVKKIMIGTASAQMQRPTTVAVPVSRLRSQVTKLTTAAPTTKAKMAIMTSLAVASSSSDSNSISSCSR